MSFRKWWKFAYENGIRGGRIKWCSYLYKSSEEPMFGIFVHYSTRPIYDVSMNLFCWPPSVDIFNILHGFLWQPLLMGFILEPVCYLYNIIKWLYRKLARKPHRKEETHNLSKVSRFLFKSFYTVVCLGFCCYRSSCCGLHFTRAGGSLKPRSR